MALFGAFVFAANDGFARPEFVVGDAAGHFGPVILVLAFDGKAVGFEVKPLTGCQAVRRFAQHFRQ